MPNRTGVEEDEVAVGDLQNKISSGVGGGGSNKILRQSSQLFWPIEMEYSGKKVAE